VSEVASGIRPSYLRCAGLGLFASPAAVLWVLTRPSTRETPRRWIAAVSVVAVVAAGLLLLTSSLRFDLVAAAWGAFCLLASLAAAALIPGRISDEIPDRHPWSRQTLRALVPLIFLMPSLGALAGLLGAHLTGGLLARLNPDVVDPRAVLGLLVLDSFWLIPCGAVFAAASLRRGRLGRPADLFTAAASWAAFLLLRQIFVQGALGALQSQKIGVEGFDQWNQWQVWVVQGAFILASVPVTLHLAWGPGSWRSRLGGAVLLLGVATVNLAVLVGANSRVSFVTARILERSGRVPAALSWYGRALEADSDPALASYLQHRIGLLHYKLGDLERARAAFRLLTTTRNANPELVAEGRYYLERLSEGRPERRRVLPGVEVPTEMRDAYCAPNTLALAFRFLGRPVSVSELGEKVTLLGLGTSGSDIRFLADEYGFDHLLVPFATLDDVRWLIDRGIPALLYRPGHVLSVFGYDDRLGTAVAFDTSRWDIWVDRPYPDLEREWGEGHFLLGVVLPRSGGRAVMTEVAEARKRFAGPRADAAWQWWLAQEGDREERLRRSVLADPGFSLAVFDLLGELGGDAAERSQIAWIESHADIPAVEAEARRLIGREHSAASEIAQGLARWYYAEERWQDLVDFSRELERRRLHPAVSTEAGIAAARLGDWQRAVFLLEMNVKAKQDDDEEDDGGPHEAEAQARLIEADLALGRTDAAADNLGRWSRSVEDDDLDRILEHAEALSGDRGPVFLEDLYSSHLYSRPEDVDIQLRMADVSLKAARELPEDRQDRIQHARRAATLARAFASDPETRRKAEALLAEARRMSAAQGSGR
jgi:tetratricopeptide (TPR) repeat protein